MYIIRFAIRNEALGLGPGFSSSVPAIEDKTRPIHLHQLPARILLVIYFRLALSSI